MTRHRVHLELETDQDEGALIRLLKALLKMLGRTYQVRCRSATMEALGQALGVSEDPK